MNILSLRKEYTLGALHLHELDHNPFGFFGKWLQQAIDAEVAEPNAMVVSTVGSDGYPQSRVVLLKSFDESGFSFFTNYDSRKGQALRENNKVALLFFWPELQRQIRITGSAFKVPESESNAYFSSRPVNSQIGAWASPQSREIESREYLETCFDAFSQKFHTGQIPMPGFWGGFQVIPHQFEYWQGRESRLHDRFQYDKAKNGWTIKRLAP